MRVEPHAICPVQKLLAKSNIINVLVTNDMSIYEAILGPEASKEIIIATISIVPIDISSTNHVLGYGECLHHYSIVFHGESGPSLAQIVLTLLVGYDSIRVVLVFSTLWQCGQGGMLRSNILGIIVGHVVFAEHKSTIVIKVVGKVVSVILPPH